MSLEKELKALRIAVQELALVFAPQQTQALVEKPKKDKKKKVTKTQDLSEEALENPITGIEEQIVYETAKPANDTHVATKPAKPALTIKDITEPTYAMVKTEKSDTLRQILSRFIVPGIDKKTGVAIVRPALKASELLPEQYESYLAAVNEALGV